MTDEHIKEELSFAYTQAISAYAGMGCEQRRRDYGIDGSIKEIKYSTARKRYIESGFSIDFQLKSTVNAKINNGIILYDLACIIHETLSNGASHRIVTVFLSSFVFT